MSGAALTQRLAQPASPKVQSRQNRTVRRILDESARLFLARGYDNVSVDEIVAAAEIGRSTFYRFYANREEVLAAIARPVFEAGIAAMARLQAVPPAQVLPGLFQMYLDLWREGSDALRLSTRMGGPWFRLFADVHETFKRDLTRLVGRVAPTGLLISGNADYTARLLARTAVPVMEVYCKDHRFETLFHQTMSGFLLAPETPTS